MSLHIGASKGQIAETVLLPGDPLRAKFIAENFFRKSEAIFGNPQYVRLYWNI